MKSSKVLLVSSVFTIATVFGVAVVMSGKHELVNLPVKAANKQFVFDSRASVVNQFNAKDTSDPIAFELDTSDQVESTGIDLSLSYTSSEFDGNDYIYEEMNKSFGTHGNFFESSLNANEPNLDFEFGVNNLTYFSINFSVTDSDGEMCMYTVDFYDDNFDKVDTIENFGEVLIGTNINETWTNTTGKTVVYLTIAFSSYDVVEQVCIKDVTVNWSC